MTEKQFRMKPRTNAKGETLYRCPFPNCGAIFAKEPGKPEACLKHRQLIEDVLYILDHTHYEPGPQEKKGEEQPPTGPKIFVPKPGMGDKAVEEARRAARQQTNPH